LDKKHPALLELAKIVRGADTPNRSLTPYSEGLAALASGFSIISKDDHENMEKQFYVYDASMSIDPYSIWRIFKSSLNYKLTGKTWYDLQCFS
jgi:hypothetical protein